MPEHDEQTVIPADYPELKMLVWNRDPTRPITADDAFSIYERNWRFVDPNLLTDKERQLIDQLTNDYGCGRILA